MSGPLRLSDYVRDLALADGKTIHIRPIESDDLLPIRQMWNRLSPETIRLRFFAPLTLDDVRLRHFVEVDNINRFALVAEVDDRIVAVARFDRLPEDPSTADFGITVEDAEQGRGLGTALLQALVEPAHDLGITAFHGDILKANESMLRVMRDAGFQPAIRDYGDMVSATFTTTPSETVLERAGELRRRAAREALTAVLRPTSVAVVGASRQRDTVGGMVLANLLAEDFSGVVYPVNPHADHVQGVRAYASIADCPTVPDLALICVPAALADTVVDQAGRAGVRAAVLFGTGYSEEGEEGLALEQALLATARRHGIRLLGPNCMGVVNASAGVRMNGSLSRVVPPPGRIGLSSQSGTLGMAILSAAEAGGLGLSTFASLGNRVDLSSNDVLQYWETDEETDVIVLYLESFGNPRTFTRVARRVARRKPIVVVKAGRRDTDDEVVQAMFDATGVIRVPTLEQMFTVASLLAEQPAPAGPRVGIVANGSGPAVLAADACEAAGLHVAPLHADRVDELPVAAVQGEVRNPLALRSDVGAEQLGAAVRAVAASGAVDSLLVVFSPVLPTQAHLHARALVDAARQVDLPLVTVFMAADRVPDELRAAGIPVVAFPEGAAEALGHVTRYAQWCREPMGNVVTFADTDTDGAQALIDGVLTGADRVTLDPDQAAALLSAHGIPSAAHRIVADADGAADAVEDLGGRVVVKPAAPVRRAGLGAVRLGVVGADQARAAVAAISRELDAAGMSHVAGEGWLVQEMIADGVETTLAVSSDPTFGPVASIAMGGTVMELLADRVVKVLPLTDRDVDEMLQQLRGYPLLAGHHGSRPVSVVSLRIALLRLSALVEAHPEVVDLELGPVFVSAGGISVVDARITLERPEQEAAAPDQLA